MIVRDLIELLQRISQNVEIKVLIPGDDEGYDVREVAENFIIVDDRGE